MKTKAYILFFLFAVLAFSTQAQITTFHGIVSVKENRVGLAGTTLSFDLNIELSGLSVGRYQTLTITPTIRAGHDSFALSPIVVNGANKQKMYDRERAFHGKAAAAGDAYVVIKNNPLVIRQISYQKSIPYKPWMKGAQLVLVGVLNNYDGKPVQEYTNVLTDELRF